MKKTISINIGSIIFHIEEDGYDKLKNYLDSVNKYFSTFEDNSEIIADIESRIAEIFLNKLADGRQTVTIEDVEDLMVTMGTTSDFDASLEPEVEETKTANEPDQPKSEGEPAWEGFKTEKKRLYRNTRHKILGGVASGIAHYFSVDPIWIRLLFLGLLFNFFFAPFSGVALLGYIILWIVVPANAFLEDDKTVKKLFRDSQRRVISGVASGIAAYFGTDVSVIRLLFVLSIIPGGVGLIVYIVLWIISPEAKTITEQMQMQGEPVTLSNIEQNVKKGLKVEDGEESPIVKVLLFPFRLIAIIINGLGKVIGPLFKVLGEILRVAFGIFIVVIGFVIMIGLSAGLLGLFGIGGWEHYVHFGDFPVELIQKSLDGWALVAGYLVILIPALAVSLLGLVIILKRPVANNYVGWSLFTVWVGALVLATFSIPRFASEFSSEDDIRIEKTYEVSEAIPTLKLNDIYTDSFDAVDLRLRGHSDSSYQLTLNVESRGSSRKNAQDNAKSVTYNVEQRGEDFYFDSDITFDDKAQFRFQNIKAYFYIPYGKTFRMEEDLEEILINTLSRNGYKSYQMEGNDWVFERDGIQCLTCGNTSSSKGSLSSGAMTSSRSGRDKIVFPFEDFDEVTIASYMDIDIRRGDEWQVILRGDEDDLDEVSVNQVGDELEIRFKEDSWEWWKDRNGGKVAAFIVMPELDYLEVVGDTDGDVIGFDGAGLTIDAVGACDLRIDIDVRELDINLTGASSADVRGEVTELSVEAIGASRLEAFELNAAKVYVSVVGASKAEVYASDEIEIDAVGASKVRYRGTKNIRINDAGFSSVRRD